MSVALLTVSMSSIVKSTILDTTSKPFFNVSLGLNQFSRVGIDNDVWCSCQSMVSAAESALGNPKKLVSCSQNRASSFNVLMALRATQLLGRTGLLVMVAESSTLSCDLIYDKVSNHSTAAAEMYSPSPGGPSCLHPPQAIQGLVALLRAPWYLQQGEEWQGGGNCHDGCKWQGSRWSTTWLLCQLQFQPPGWCFWLFQAQWWCSGVESLFFGQQFWIIVCITASHALFSKHMASSWLTTKMSSSPASSWFNDCTRRSLQKWAFRQQMMPALAGWMNGVRLGLKHSILMWVILSCLHLCPLKLSIKSRILQFCHFIISFISSIACANISPVIQAFLLKKYQKPNSPPYFLRKHHGFWAVVMKSRWIFSVPVAFIITSTDMHVLSNFLPGSPFVDKPWFCTDFQKKLVLLALKTLLRSRIFCTWTHSSSTLVRLTEPASPCLT